MDYVVVTFLIMLSGLFSGLTLSLLSLDKNEIRRKAALGNKNAQKVYAVRKNGNLLLSTLLLGNVAVNSAIAIFLGDLTSGVVAGVVSTSLIVIFGEIIPQATFSRHALKVGAHTAWVVKIFIFILFPICYPIAFILDKALGKEMSTIYSKKELIEIIKEHEDSEESELDSDEERIIKGALSFSDKIAEQIMTSKPDVYMLEVSTVLNNEILNKIKEKGFTRIPVYQDSADNVLGMLYTKDLITTEAGAKLSEVYKKVKPLVISKEKNLDHLLNMFIKSKKHLAIIQSETGKLKGVVSLEDVLEEIIEQEIIDETDNI